MDEDDLIQDEQADQDESQESESQSSGFNDLKDTQSNLKQLSKHGPKAPTAGGTTAASEAGAAAGGAGSAAGTGAAAAGTGAAAAGTGAAAAGTGAAAATAPIWIWIVIGIIIFIILFLIIAVIMGGSEDENSNNADKLVFIKTGPAAVPNKSDIVYKLGVSYGGTAEDIIIRDPIPDNTEFITAMPAAKTLDASGIETDDPALVKTVEWSLKEIQNTVGQSTFQLQDLSLAIRPLTDDIYVLNQASAQVVGGEGSPVITPGEGGVIPPNDTDCNGAYASYIPLNPLKKNFGDPNCSMIASKPEDKDKLYNYIKSLDSADVYMWFSVIIPQESSYITNNFNGDAVDDCGAWGLFQMNRSTCVTLSGSSDEAFLKYKHGDVNWEIQTTNAINYGKGYRSYFEKYENEGLPCLNAKWHFWSAASEFWECGKTWPTE